jgi:hypothetical protein
VIVISGALVVVAIVLLAIGLISGTLGFIYASIAGSVVAFIFLIVGVMQRRGEEVPAMADAGPAPSLAAANDVEGVTAIIPSGARPSRSTESAEPDLVAAVRRPTRDVPAAPDAPVKAPAKRTATKAPATAAAATKTAARKAPAAKKAAAKAPAKTAAKKAPAKTATKTAAKKAPAKTAAKKAPAKAATKAAAKKAPAKKTAAKKAAPRR